MGWGFFFYFLLLIKLYEIILYMGNILSFSQISKYKYCPMSWKFHYVDKIRPTRISSALLFGGAIGKAFEQALITRDKEKAFETFHSQWEEQELNKVPTKLRFCKDIDYFKTDLDLDLGMTEWETLLVKGKLMIESFFINLLPLIEHVYSTEEKVELTSGEDSSIGFADAVVRIKGYDKPIVLDFKTAGKAYLANSVKESEQLSQYLHSLSGKYENTRYAGYAVFLKNINKNKKKICNKCGYDGSGGKHKTCNNNNYTIPSGIGVVGVLSERCNGEWFETIHPTCTMQLIIDQIPEEMELNVIDNIGEVNDNINMGIVAQNFDACNNNYGRKCDYFNLCHKDSMIGLIKMGESIK